MKSMTPMERVVTTLGHKEPDRVPLFFTFTMHGAQELGLPIRDYFSQAEHVAEGQMRLYDIYHSDILYSFFYAAVEVEAWGADVLYSDDSPPNAGEPFIKTPDQIASLHVPDVRHSPSLLKVLRATELLQQRSAGTIPIAGVVMSPFSLPVMQMGFEKYIELIYDRPDMFDILMRVNEEFCVAWANAQFEAGATAIAYFDPVSSSTIIPRDLYLKTGYPIAQRVIARLKGPTVMLLASGRVLPILDDIATTGASVVGASTTEDLAQMKTTNNGRMTLLGNLNAIEMCRWTSEQAEAEVKQAIASAAPGGGFILCDNHGEIPWQVPASVLHAIVDAVNTWGTYPLDWIDHEQSDGTRNGKWGRTV